MSQNYPRAWSIQIDGLGTYVTDGIRVRFSIKQGTVGMPNIATIRLTNSLRSAAEQFCKNPASEGKFVSISAGYAGNSGVLFKGNVVRPIYGRENPTDTLLQVLCADGEQATSVATVSKTLPPNSTPQDQLNTAMQAMQKYGVKLGWIGSSIDLSMPKYPRSIALVGQAKKVVDEIARSKGATWGFQNLALEMATPADSKGGGGFELNSSTGMIGMPSLTPDGVYVRTLINPQMKIHNLVHIDQSLIQGYLPSLGPGGVPLPGQTPGPTVASVAADGIYRIVKIDTDGDSRGQPWYQDMLVLNPGVTTPVSVDYGD